MATEPVFNPKYNMNFRFWCQKVLPLVYDDSLSYYEVLCKLVDHLNDVIDSQNNLNDAFIEYRNWLTTEWNDYRTLMDTNYANFVREIRQIVADLQAWVTGPGLTQAVQDQLNRWLADGTLADLINNEIFSSIQDAIVTLQNALVVLRNDAVLKNEAGVVNMNMLADDVKTAITGGSVAIVGNNSVYTDAIQNQAVSSNKIRPSANVTWTPVTANTYRFNVNTAAGSIEFPANYTIVIGSTYYRSSTSNTLILASGANYIGYDTTNLIPVIMQSFNNNTLFAVFGLIEWNASTNAANVKMKRDIAYTIDGHFPYSTDRLVPSAILYEHAKSPWQQSNAVRLRFNTTNLTMEPTGQAIYLDGQQYVPLTTPVSIPSGFNYITFDARDRLFRIQDYNTITGTTNYNVGTLLGGVNWDPTTSILTVKMRNDNLIYTIDGQYPPLLGKTINIDSIPNGSITYDKIAGGQRSVNPRTYTGSFVFDADGGTILINGIAVIYAGNIPVNVANNNQNINLLAGFQGLAFDFNDRNFKTVDLNNIANLTSCSLLMTYNYDTTNVTVTVSNFSPFTYMNRGFAPGRANQIIVNNSTKLTNFDLFNRSITFNEGLKVYADGTNNTILSTDNTVATSGNFTTGEMYFYNSIAPGGGIGVSNATPAANTISLGYSSNSGTIKGAFDYLLNGNCIAVVGDSILAGVGTTNAEGTRTNMTFGRLVCSSLGVKDYNFAVSGMGFLRPVNSETFYDRLVSIVTNTDGYSPAGLIFMGGVNDFLQNQPMGDINTANTFAWAVERTLSYISDNFATRPVAFCLPLPCQSMNTPNTEGLVLQDYVDVIQDRANHYKLDPIDLLNRSGMDVTNQIHIDEMMPDGLHPNVYLHVKVAPMVKSKLVFY